MKPSFHKVKDGEPCNHKGCLSHVNHPCEVCGRRAAQGEATIIKSYLEADDPKPIVKQFKIDLKALEILMNKKKWGWNNNFNIV